MSKSTSLPTVTATDVVAAMVGVVSADVAAMDAVTFARESFISLAIMTRGAIASKSASASAIARAAKSESERLELTRGELYTVTASVMRLSRVGAVYSLEGDRPNVAPKSIIGLIARIADDKSVDRVIKSADSPASAYAGLVELEKSVKAAKSEESAGSVDGADESGDTPADDVEVSARELLEQAAAILTRVVGMEIDADGWAAHLECVTALDMINDATELKLAV